MKVSVPLVSAALLALASVADAQLNGVKLYGINYDRQIAADWFPDDVKCKNQDAVWKDMEQLATITQRVRLYGLREGFCDTNHILDAARGKVKVALGVWPQDDKNFAKEYSILEKMLQTGKIDDNIESIIVGSEAIYRPDYPAQKAVDYLYAVRDLLKRYGKSNIKLTISDTLDSYYQNMWLIDHVDYVSINQFSFWEAADINDGMRIMLDRIRSIRMKAAAQGKELVVSETGWASGGEGKNAGVASMANQKKFFEDFYRQATAQNLPYYWFTAYENEYRKEEVERHFGMLTQQRQFKESFKNLNLVVPKVIKFRASSGGYLAETFNPDRIEEVTGIEFINESSDKLTALRYQWFYDEAKGQVRSINSDRCLDAYQPQNGGIVHTYRCVDAEVNQKWQYDASTKQLKHTTHKGFCLSSSNGKPQLWSCAADDVSQQFDTGASSPTNPTNPTPSPTSTPTPGAESTAVRFFAKESKDPKSAVQLVRDGDSVKVGSGAQGAAGSEWTYDSATKLVRSKDSEMCLDAYEAWDGGRVHVYNCNANEVNQRWDFDSSTGQLKHHKHTGFCLDNDQVNGVIQLWGCHLNNNNQVWRMVSASAKTVQITNSDKSVIEFVSRNQQLLTVAANKDSQTWFWNPFKNTFTSKWGNECLDADNGAENAGVHTWDCIAGETNQRWSFDNGLIKHLKHQGKCLAYNNAADKSLVLKTCASSDASQAFTLAAL